MQTTVLCRAKLLKKQDSYRLLYHLRVPLKSFFQNARCGFCPGDYGFWMRVALSYQC
eukprot:jgi/Botrbrau1/13406/Bobra.0082s0013.1